MSDKIDLQQIADKGLLFLLERLDREEGGVSETKALLMRKINGDPPTKKEWADNARVIHCSGVYAYENLVALTMVSAGAISCANAGASTHAYDYTHPGACVCARTYVYATANYIIGLLGDYLSLIEHGKELEKYFGCWMAGEIYKKATGEK